MPVKKVVEQKCANCDHSSCCQKLGSNQGGSSSAVYGLGFVGALIYFFPTMNTFNGVIMGIVKSLVWPGILVHQAFTLLGL